jgi:hypothetical protein
VLHLAIAASVLGVLPIHWVFQSGRSVSPEGKAPVVEGDTLQYDKVIFILTPSEQIGFSLSVKNDSFS